jgi:hypothetical protein
MHCVFFFGTHNHAWIMETDLKPYMEFKETLNRDKKSGNFRKAIDEIEEFLAGKGNFKTSAGTQAAAALASAGNHDPEKDAEFDALLSTKKSASKSAKRPRKQSAVSDESPSVAKKAKSKPKKSLLKDEKVTPESDEPSPVVCQRQKLKQSQIRSQIFSQKLPKFV